MINAVCIVSVFYYCEQIITNFITDNYKANFKIIYLEKEQLLPRKAKSL